MSSSQGNRALWLSSYTKPLKIVNLPMPGAPTGTVVAKISPGANRALRYTHLAHTGHHPQLNIHPPFVLNLNAIGPGAANVKPGDLAHIDATTRGRDEPVNVMVKIGHLAGVGNAGQKLLKEWGDGSPQ
ncbi:hypothetical protein CORC01_05677 [Colletotrichum orchidophilum]|uniref:Uncharacterized protein n=1 Tax=Colletotrichum orchidophilum TaxID=1209926 RepID=A0A1G4BC97_9PEZI|nr:uncharacterized protein CORC01_05677 [Colletotrichum orchidophilum]OHE98987.1 hypothetical protein CORC01_05677 [Colletotrichum orchidophilum]